MKPGTLSFTTAALTALAVLGMAVAAIWTGDGRWGSTAFFLGIAALVLVVVGSAKAAAAEKKARTGCTPGWELPENAAVTNRATRPAPIMTSRPKPPRQSPTTKK